MYHFFAYMSRMKHIIRWGLMRNTDKENIQEHSLQVAMIAHALAVIHNRSFNGNIDENRVATLAVFHEAGEVITGDLPTPIKYFNNDIRDAYKRLEYGATEMLLEMLPERMKDVYSPLLVPAGEDAELYKFVKAADRICAYIKCVQEENAGNRAFEKAQKSILASIQDMDMPEVHEFFALFMQSFSLTLDELN